MRRGTKASGSAKPTSSALTRFVESTKHVGVVIPTVSQHLIKEHLRIADPRRHDVIHPSEMSKSDWCPRATYTRIAMARDGVKLPGEVNRFQLENIFAEGDRIHEKWQGWLGDAGVLWGRWHCMVCGHRFIALSPTECPQGLCASTALKYDEVPMFVESHLIEGHSDGEIRIEQAAPRLLEIKSVGDGTIRVELPQTFYKYTRKSEDHTCFDLAGCLRDLKRPFPSHLRQGWLYLWLRAQAFPNEPEVNEIQFLYEGKATQYNKEFTVRRSDEMIEDLLDHALDVVYGLEVGKAPSCREGRRVKCAQCLEYETGSSEPGKTQDSQPRDAARRADGDSGSRPRQARPRRAAEAEGRGAGRRAGSADRVQRRSAARADGEVQRVGGLFGAAAGAVRGGRDRGQDAARARPRRRTGEDLA